MIYNYRGHNLELDDVLIDQVEKKVIGNGTLNDEWVEKLISSVHDDNVMEPMSNEKLKRLVVKGMRHALNEQADVRNAWKRYFSDNNMASYVSYEYKGVKFSLNEELINQHKDKTGIEVTNDFLASVLSKIYTEEQFKAIPIDD